MLSLSLCFSLLGGCSTPAFYAAPSSSIQEKSTKNSEYIYYKKYKKLKKKFKSLENLLQNVSPQNEEKSLNDTYLYALKIIVNSVSYIVMGAFISAAFFSGHPIMQAALIFTSGACGSIKEILKGY